MSAYDIHQTVTFKNWLTSIHDAAIRIGIARRVESALHYHLGASPQGLITATCNGQEWRLPYAYEPDLGFVVQFGGAATADKTEGKTELASTQWGIDPVEKAEITPFDIATYLLSESDIVVYLEMLLADADAKEISMAIEQVNLARSAIKASHMAFSLRDNTAAALAKVLRKLGFILTLNQDYQKAV